MTNKFASRLRALRKTVNISQEDLSKALKISRSTIGMYEQGRREPDFETLEKIADFFNVPMSSLIDNSEPVLIKTDAEIVADKIRMLDRDRFKKLESYLDFLLQGGE